MGPEVAIIATVASSAFSAVGAIKQGNAAKAAADYNAQVARNNAEAARQRATAQAERQERQARIRRGQNIARAAASGVALEGSALDLFEDNAIEEELDRLSILYQGEVDATGFGASASLDEMRGRAARNAGYVSAAGTLLGGAAKSAGIYADNFYEPTPEPTPRLYRGLGGQRGGILGDGLRG